MSFTDSGEHEEFKACVHGVMLLLAAGCLYYNAKAWRRRRETHLACNIALYTAAVVIEGVHVAHHISSVLEEI